MSSALHVKLRAKGAVMVLALIAEISETAGWIIAVSVAVLAVLALVGVIPRS
jgi:hypothetical protein